MRTERNSIRMIWLFPAVALVACSGKRDSDQGAAAANAQEAPAPTPQPAPTPVTVTLAPKNGSGMSGTVVLTSRGDSTEIALTLSGGRSGTKYPSHIHAGNCATPGEVVAPLESVTVGPDKSGTSTTMVATSVLDSARTKYGSLIEQSHLPNMKPAACADIPAQ